MRTIRTRRQAAELGLSKYYTGRSCKRGHDGMRYTKTGGCVQCNNVYSRGYNEQLAAKVTGQKVVKVLVNERDIPRLLEFVNQLNRSEDV